MKIQYLGHSSFLLKEKEVQIVMDPFNPAAVGFKFPKVEADIVTVSHAHGDHNYTEGVGPKPVVFDFPGEYEARGIKIFGYQSFHDGVSGAERGENIVFSVILNNLKITHLGDIGGVPTGELLEQIDDTDILLLPVGGIYTINPQQAVDTVKAIKPGIIIPMHFKTEKHDPKIFAEVQPVSSFLKLMGHEALEPVTKLEIKSEEELPENEVVLLQAL